MDEVSFNNDVNVSDEGDSKAIKAVNIESRKNLVLKPCVLKENNPKLCMCQLA